MAFTCREVAAQTSHTTSPGLAAGSGEPGEQMLLKASAISLKAVLMLISGRLLKVFPQVGHLQIWLLSHTLWMHSWQKLWPHGVVTGLVNTCWQMAHWNCFSDNIAKEAIICRVTVTENRK